MLKLSNKKYKPNKDFRRIIRMSKKDIITIKKVNDEKIIFTYFDNEPKDTFRANIIKNGLIIRVNRNIPKYQVISEFIRFWKKVRN